ncbi:MAG: hypothetical protein ACRDRQ_23560 [Pseudonocardiaceae bacterium]
MAKSNSSVPATGFQNNPGESPPNGFRDIFEQATAYTPVDLVKMAFARPGPDLTAGERELIKEQAVELAKRRHDDLAQLAAALLHESLKIKSIFANFLHCMYQEDKAKNSASAQRERHIQFQAEYILMQPQLLASQRARTAAFAKLSNDPRQLAKAEARNLWQERRAGKHPKLRTNEQFATECIRRWPVLRSSKVICGWCTKWNKEAKDQNPAS